MRTEKGLNGETLEAELDQVLGNFKASVHAWSEAAYSRPRSVETVRHRSWRLAASWALGCVLVAGSLSGDMYARHHRHRRHHEVDTMAAAQQAQQQAVQERTSEEDSDLLATVDTEVSREVPSAMEPLAQLMDQGANQ